MLAFSLSSSAELPEWPAPHGKPDFKKILDMRFGVIVHELCLDEGKANKLRPLYMEYCQKVGEIFRPQQKPKPKDQRTDAEVEQEIKADFTKAKKMVNLRETYYNKFRKILTPKQIEKIYDIERNEQRMIHQHRFAPKK